MLFHRRRVLWSLLALTIAAVVACETVPITGRSQLQLISPSEEMKLGVQSYQEILKKSKLSTDVAATAMVRRVGGRIGVATGRTDFAWEYNLLDDKQVNAFALPGGKVAVYTGILPVTRDEAGLAAVLGHEIAHVIARHGGERVSQQAAVQGAASLLAGFASNDPQTVQTVASLLGAGGSVGLLLPWGRNQESEADHLGIIYMAKAGYDPHAARDLWVRMAEASKGQARPPEFLSTHPAEATRIQQIEAWMPEAMRYYKPQR